MESLDFTPFGFTPTESLVYEALLERGPSSGYRLSKAISIARANTYQALNGLVAKGAAVAGEETPRVFRAVAPDALLALVARGQARQLDRLERQLRDRGSAGEPAIVPIRGERELQELVLRTAARAAGPVSFLGTERQISQLLPVWRKRAADGADTELWVAGARPKGFPLTIKGTVDADALERHFGAPATILLAPGATVLATAREGSLSGYWSSDPILRGAASACLAALTA
ncbi:MAG: helix-turn-helix domain-containing protein [Gemmatimonadota bacterium]|nr:MAG: helix-turn-helix domain-containing protein [Gemmatimonadota bacterium]